MRGQQDPQVTMLAFIDLETRGPAEHPLHAIKALADQALTVLSPVFDRMYAEVGRPSIPPEWLLKASLLIALLVGPKAHSSAVCSCSSQTTYSAKASWFDWLRPAGTLLSKRSPDNALTRKSATATSA